MHNKELAPDTKAQSPMIPPTVWALGWVSLFMDLSSELIHSLLPVFIVSSLGASMVTLGLLEGIAEATALIVKIFSGALSDYFGRRKGLLLIGYGLGALSKPLFPLAHTLNHIVIARILDRIGKGIRGAPRDALVADIAPPEIRGACFGLRQSMDTVGAVLGPLVAIVLMLWLNNIQMVFWFALLPAAVVIGVLLCCVQESPQHPTGHGLRNPIHWHTLRHFSRRYWWIVLSGGIFTLTRFSEAFLVLRAQQVGLATAWLPIIMVVMSLSYTLSAYPAGWLSDRLSRYWLLLISLLWLILADLWLARATSVPAAICGAALWGLHMGFSQGIFASLVADTTDKALKGTAFGIFNLICGLCMLLASALAGALWQYWGAAVTFYTGAGLALLTLLLLSIQTFSNRHHSTT